MIKKLLLFIIFSILATQIHAQYKPVLFGLRVGADLGWVKPDTEEYESEGVQMGFTWGFIGEFFLMENYAIATGFNVNFIGGEMSYPYVLMTPNFYPLGTLYRKYNLKYIQIPLCLKMKTDISDKFRLFGKIGLGTAFKLSAKATDDFVFYGGTESYPKRNIDEEVALMRESLIIGGGVEYKLKGSTALMLELIYDNAFNNMLTGEDQGYMVSDPKAFLNYVELVVGIVF